MKDGKKFQENWLRCLKNLEVLLFTLQSKMRANNKTPFTPREGKTIMDINNKEFWQSDQVKNLYPNEKGRN